MSKLLQNLRRGAPISLMIVACLTVLSGFAIVAFLPDYLIRHDALTTARALAADRDNFSNPRLALADNRALLQFVALDAGLNVIANERDEAMAPAFVIDRTMSAVARGAMKEMAPALMRVAGHDQDVITRVLLPVHRSDTQVRLIVVDIDQSPLTHILNEGLRAAFVLLLVVSGVAVLVTTLFNMRRTAERRAGDERIRFLALHDALTGLPNRVQLKEHLGNALARAKQRGSQVGVLCLDLDRFKEVNDTLGHAAGDELLTSVASRLRASLRDGDLVARMGGDEFAIVIEDPSTLGNLEAMAYRLCRELARPHNIDRYDFSTSGSIGIAMAPLDGNSTDRLLRNADLALYRAKAAGRNTFTFFEQGMDKALKERSMLENDLRHALSRKELYVAYQPQFNLITGALCGNEALVRWYHPERGNVAPAIFIPLAEESGLIHTIGEWVLETACRQAVSWPGNVKLAINLSPCQFKTGDIVSLIARILGETRLDPRRLDFEIPETVLLDTTQTLGDKLDKLRQLGVAVTIDDFGTGFSSLRQLSRFAFDRIKIDRSFVGNIKNCDDNNAIIDAIVGIGSSLGAEIAAEGIETQGQVDALREAGCVQVQGYLYGEPREQVISCESGMRTTNLIRHTWNAA